MRLSHGFVRGEALSCIYHGWSYAQSGQCQRIPAHPDLEPPEAIRVPVHHATESGGVVWVALSATTAAPPALTGLLSGQRFTSILVGDESLSRRPMARAPSAAHVRHALLRQRGWGDEALAKLWGGNTLRVLRAVQGV